MIEDIFKCVVGCACGICCSRPLLCDTCVINTLKANGLPLAHADEIRGLSQFRYGNSGRFDYSDLCNKLTELIKAQNKR